MKEVELVIIGGGPAGMAAAIEAAGKGVSVALVDESRSLGGKVLKSQEDGLQIDHTDEIEARIARQLLYDFEQVEDKIEVYLQAEVWGIDNQKTVQLYCENAAGAHSKSIRAQKLIIAVGALERTVPFPGWTLPGVFTVGGLNSLIKKGVIAGEKFVVAGSGLLQLVLAQNLIKAGATISALVEAASMKDVIASSAQLLSGVGWQRLKQGLQYLRAIRSHKIPIFSSHVVAKANGDQAVNGVVITQVDANWKPIPGTEKDLAADTLAVGYGLIPSNELTRLCGCRHDYDDRLGYWKIQHKSRMETSVAGIFVAGDDTRIKGYAAAIDEGRIAGIEACVQLGKTSKDQADKSIRTLEHKLQRATRFARAIDGISSPKPGLLDVISDDTVVCRCEEVTFSEIHTAVTNGAADINDIKRRTRSGMGHCQGRYCGQVINELLWKLAGYAGNREYFTPRIPAKSVPFGALANQKGRDSIY
jgi:hydrogen cyanide synthase HcnB